MYYFLDNTAARTRQERARAMMDTHVPNKKKDVAWAEADVPRRGMIEKWELVITHAREIE